MHDWLHMHSVHHSSVVIISTIATSQAGVSRLFGQFHLQPINCDHMLIDVLVFFQNMRMPLLIVHTEDNLCVAYTKALQHLP
jgi:hypothetical protein